MRWYLNRTGTGEGPFDEPTLLGMIGRGEALANHQICPEGQQAWQALDSHPPFAQALAGPSQPAAPVAAPGAGAAAAPGAGAAAAPGGGFGAAAPAAGAQANVGADPVASDVNAAANAVAGEVNAAANAFGGALAAPGGQAPVLTAPGAAAPGEGFFELARAEGTPPSDDAKAGAGMAHLLGAAGAFVSCGCFGGIAGAFLGSILYKEQPKSPFALYHVNQAVVFQGVIFVVNVAWSIFVQVLTIVGAMIVPFLGLLSILHIVNLALWAAAIILPLLQRGKAKRGEWSEYPMVGKKVMGLKSPILK